MRTAQFEGNIPMAFSLEDAVANSLIEKATEHSKKTKKTASSFVNNMLKLALENQDILNAVENAN
jgi:hypothetical protein